MHELGVARNLFELVLQKATENNLKKITKISVKLGEAAGIEKDFLSHSFADHLLPGSIADGCELEITIEKVKAICKNCGTEFLPSQTVWDCPHCQTKNIEIISGRDVYVTSIEGESH
ncbi:MAG: hydrogenase maturation nickel metallochaperone HypA [Elusimicrobiota bacterium]